MIPLSYGVATDGDDRQGNRACRDNATGLFDFQYPRQEIIKYVKYITARYEKPPIWRILQSDVEAYGKFDRIGIKQVPYAAANLEGASL